MLPPSLHQQSSNMAYGSLAAAQLTSHNAVAAANNNSNSNALLAQSLGLPGTSSSLLIEKSLKAAANKSSHGNVNTTSQPAGSALSAASLLLHGLGLATRNNNSLESFALSQQLQLQQQQQQQQSGSGVKQLLDRVKVGLLQDYLAQEKTRLIQEAYLKLLQQNQASAQVPPSAFTNAHFLQGFKSLEQGTATPYNLSLTAARAVEPSPAVSAPPSQSSPLAPVAAAVEPPSARRVADAIGSQLRTGQPYIDVTALPGLEETGVVAPRNRGGVTESFPEKLHRMLQEAEENGMTDIVSFLPHGRAFCVHNIDGFVAKILPNYFKQSKWNSFARQLNLYGFMRVTSGPDAGAYYHELFLKGRSSLCLHMRRVGVPQSNCDRRKFKTKLADSAPDFYSMKALV